MSEPETPASGGGLRAVAGFGVLLLLVAYAAFLHHGLGPVPDGAIEPWSPREFLKVQSWVEPLEESPALGVAAFSLPAMLLAAVVFWLTGSAVVRSLAVAAVVGAALFSFYGLRPPGPGIWRFFGWRGSGVMVSLALVVGATATAPLLARSWLRLPVAARVGIYLPVFVAVVIVLRNVTGTDPTLRFAISPWPVVPLFGMTIGSVAILGILAGMACGAFSFAAAGRWRAIGLVGALLFPAVWFKVWHTSFPANGMVVLVLLAAPWVLGAGLGARGPALVARGRHLTWGFALAVVPLLAGQALAGLDYARTREGTARQVIHALDAYYQEYEEYPEELEELVARGYIEAIPRPKIGFAFLDGEPEFAYQSFGISYNLEFSAPDWVQCAYNPPWSEEDDWDEDEDWEGEEEPAAEPDGETSLGESWSCPSKPPELW